MYVNKKYIGYTFIIAIFILVIISIYSYYYNDDVEKEYFSNYIKLDSIIERM